MEANEIIRRNEAIARFMRLDIRKNRDTKGYEVDPADLAHADELSWYNPAGWGSWEPMWSLPYNRDWSFLMPCVEKMQRESGTMFESHYDDIGDGKAGYYCWFRAMPYGGLENDLRGMASTMIEATWILVSDYCLSLEPRP